jgi:MFS family permease
MGGMAPSLVTLWMQRVGIGWLAWELTHSPTWLGAVAAADLAPMLVLAPFAGAIADRGNPWKQSLITQIMLVGQAVALAAFTLTDRASIEILFALSLLSGILQPFNSTARHAIVPSTVPRDAFATAIATDSALFNASRFIGPAVAGILIPFTGVGGTFVIHSFGCSVFVFSLSFMNLPPLERSKRERRNILGDVAESFEYVRNHAGIGPLFLLLVIVSVFIRPMQDMLPGFAGSIFHTGPVGLAWLTSAMGVGAMTSAVWIAMRGHVAGLTHVAILGSLGLSLSVFGFIATDIMWVAVIAAALAGYTFNNISTSIQTLVQSTITDDFRGRIMGLYTLIYRGTPAFGSIGVGLLAEHLGLRPAFAVAAFLAFVAWAITVPRRRTITAAVEKG